jgi:predicted metal-binding membrane protein
VTPLLFIGGVASVLLLGLVLPRVTAAIVFCLFATGCAQCGGRGDPIGAVVLLIEGSVLAWCLFDMGCMQRLDRLRAKARQEFKP